MDTDEPKPVEQTSDEQMSLLHDSVLQRGVQRYREALRRLGSAQNRSVERIRTGLRAMERELTRRNCRGRKPQEQDVPSEERPGGDTAASMSADPPRLNLLEGGRERSGKSGGEAPERAARSGAAAESEERAEPVWRLIPHLGGTASKIVSVLDEAGVVRHQSRPIKWLLGFDAEVLVGEPLRAFLHPSSRSNVEEAVARMARDEEKFDSWLLEFRTASGGSLWMEGMASNFLCDPRLAGILIYWRERVG